MNAMAAQQKFVEEDFASLFQEYLKKSDITEGAVTKGTIVAVSDDFVTVDVGLKSEGQIPLKEFQSGGRIPELKIGDEVDVFVERIENRQGEAVLSREKALREEAWGRLEEACAKAEHVMGVIFGKVKGGFTVDIQGAVAFLPGSQVDIRPIKDIGPLMGVQQPFQILKMDRKRGNIVVSRRAILEESRQGQRDEILKNIKEGDTLEGIVKNITDYGAFIDMGGVDGLLHVTDISWKRINHPSEVFAIGDTIKVIVTKYDQDTKRISLGMKQLESNPWQGVDTQFKQGDRFSGRISNVTDYGAFVELADGIEGLVHVSEMSWTKKNIHPSKIVTVGQQVDVVVLEVDQEKHRISLGIKQCEDNPWQTFADKHKEGDVIDGTIRNITEFGLFIGLEGDIDGLVHHSDISWEKSGEEAIKEYSKGATVQAKILLVDVEKERVSLGIKQLSGKGGTESSAPVEETSTGSSSASTAKKNETVTVTVEAVEKDGLKVKLESGGEGYIKKIDLSSERKEQRPERFTAGDRMDAKVISVDKRGKATLSVKALEIELNKQAIRDYGSTDSGASLGDILGAALNEAATQKEPKASKPAAKAASKKKKTEE